MFRRTHRVIQQGGGGPPSVAVGSPISMVDPVTGNLLVNGAPFFMVRGDNLDYAAAIGNVQYTVTGWDVHLKAARDAGLNVISGVWGDLSSTNFPASSFSGDPTFNRYQNEDLSHWQRFGQYWWGCGGGNVTPATCAYYPVIDVACIAGFMNAHKAQPNLILWQFSGELQHCAQPLVFNPVYAVMRGIDPTRQLGDYILLQNIFLQAFNITSSTPITTAPGSFMVTPSAMSGSMADQGCGVIPWSITAGQTLQIDIGLAREYVTVTAATATTFTATFQKNHAGTWQIYGYLPQTWLDVNSNPLIIPELVMHPPWPFLPSNETDGTGIDTTGLDAMDLAWAAGRRFVYGYSITPIPELGNLTAVAAIPLTSSTPIPGPGSFQVTPSAMSGTVRGLPWSIGVGTVVHIEPGVYLKQEDVVVTSADATTFTAPFQNAHSGTWSILQYYPGSEVFPPRNQVRRVHWYCIARQCRQLAMLWGPNQRSNPYGANGDTGLTTGAAVTSLIWNRDTQRTVTAYTSGMDGTINATNDPSNILRPLLDNGRLPTPLDVYGYWVEVIADITSLKDVILAALRWTQLVTNPQAPPNGIYAASKTVGGVTYVIACNFQREQRTYPTGAPPGSDTFWYELPTAGATVTVGTGTTCIRLFEPGSPTFSGGVITDDFRAMETHVYRVT